jgi:hypothetical protein
MTSPVQETNIERILEDHLAPEIDAVNVKIKDLMDQVTQLELRKARLLRIAAAAELHIEGY